GGEQILVRSIVSEGDDERPGGHRCHQRRHDRPLVHAPGRSSITLGPAMTSTGASQGVPAGGARTKTLAPNTSPLSDRSVSGACPYSIARSRSASSNAAAAIRATPDRESRQPTIVRSQQSMIAGR